MLVSFRLSHQLVCNSIGSLGIEARTVWPRSFSRTACELPPSSPPRTLTITSRIARTPHSRHEVSARMRTARRSDRGRRLLLVSSQAVSRSQPDAADRASDERSQSGEGAVPSARTRRLTGRGEAYQASAETGGRGSLHQQAAGWSCDNRLALSRASSRSLIEHRRHPERRGRGHGTV
jgi:hypothetical protein